MFCNRFFFRVSHTLYISLNIIHILYIEVYRTICLCIEFFFSRKQWTKNIFTDFYQAHGVDDAVYVHQKTHYINMLPNIHRTLSSSMMRQYTHTHTHTLHRSLIDDIVFSYARRCGMREVVGFYDRMCIAQVWFQRDAFSHSMICGYKLCIQQNHSGRL